MAAAQDKYLEKCKGLIEGPGHGKVEEVGLVLRPGLGRPEPGPALRTTLLSCTGGLGQAYLVHRAPVLKC